MLRHATGFKLANDGIDTRTLQAYLRHRNIQNATRYTALAPDRFKGLQELKTHHLALARINVCFSLQATKSRTSRTDAKGQKLPKRDVRCHVRFFR